MKTAAGTEPTAAHGSTDDQVSGREDGHDARSAGSAQTCIVHPPFTAISHRTRPARDEQTTSYHAPGRETTCIPEDYGLLSGYRARDHRGDEFHYQFRYHLEDQASPLTAALDDGRRARHGELVRWNGQQRVAQSAPRNDLPGAGARGGREHAHAGTCGSRGCAVPAQHRGRPL